MNFNNLTAVNSTSSWSSYSDDYTYSFAFNGSISKFNASTNSYVTLDSNLPYSNNNNYNFYSYQNRIIAVAYTSQMMSYNAQSSYIYYVNTNITALVEVNGTLLTIDMISFSTNSTA
jgi:hypothetical protein